MKFTAKSSLASSAAVLLMLLAGPVTTSAAPLHGIVPQPNGGQCDFTAAVAPASATITSGQSAYFKIGLQSLGLQGTINVLITGVSPRTKYEPTFFQPAYDIWLPLNGTGTAQDRRERERKNRENDVYDYGEDSRYHRWVRLWRYPFRNVRVDRNIATEQTWGGRGLWTVQLMKILRKRYQRTWPHNKRRWNFRNGCAVFESPNYHI